MYFAKFPQSKYISMFFFGYISHLVWHEHKPRTFLKNSWEILLPIVFGHVGASMNLKAINKDVIGIAFGLFILSEFVRFCSSCCTGLLRCYKWRE